MKIISKFKDYYNGALQYDYEEDTVFVRKGKEYELLTNTLPLEIKQIVQLLVTSNLYYVTLLFFCGKVYPLLFLTEDKFGTIDDYTKLIEKRIKQRREGTLLLTYDSHSHTDKHYFSDALCGLASAVDKVRSLK